MELDPLANSLVSFCKRKPYDIMITPPPAQSFHYTHKGIAAVMYKPCNFNCWEISVLFYLLVGVKLISVHSYGAPLNIHWINVKMHGCQARIALQTCTCAYF